MLVTVVAVIVGPIAWVIWSLQLAQINIRNRGVGALSMTLVACTALLYWVLTQLAAEDVIHDSRYIFMYTVLGLAWLRVSALGFAYTGVSARDDAIERRNAAAIAALAGAFLGVTCCYAGGNIGNGPGWWVVIFSAALATAGMFLGWILLTQMTAVNDAVTIDRDPAAGVRLGAFLAAAGVMFGRAVAGDWESAAQTLRDATAVLPAVALLLGLAMLCEMIARPRAERPLAPFGILGVLPALLYAALAGWNVWAMGPPV